MVDENEIACLHPVAKGVSRLEIPDSIPECGALWGIPQVVERERRWLRLEEPVLSRL
jgi:hypothetical protein